MTLDQQQLVASLTEKMNETSTSWIVFGQFELAYMVGRLLEEVPPLSGSAPDDEGFAASPGGSYRWVCIDAEMGSAAFIFPSDQRLFEVEMREPLYALEDGLSVLPCIFGNVNDRVWITLGGAGRRAVVPAQEFLPPRA